MALENSLPQNSAFYIRKRAQGMSLFRFCLTSIMLLTTTAVGAQDFSSKYLRDVEIQTIQEKHERARVWATCAAVYDTAAVISERIQKKPVEAKEYRQMANGSEVAVAMTFVSDVIINLDKKNTELIAAKFNATWDFAKTAMNAMPETIKTTINANLERAFKGDGDLDSEITNIYSAVGICMKNVKAQQAYINMWRELASSGLLTFQK